MSTQSRIYQTIFDHCVACRLTGGWAEVSVDADCRIVPQCAADLLANLVERFSESDLIEAGVVAMENNEWILMPALANSNSPIIALRKSPETDPIDLLTSVGLVSRRDLPVIAVLEDYRTRQLASLDCRIFLTSNIGDMILLRGLGFASTIATGISQLSLEEYKFLKTAYRISLALPTAQGTMARPVMPPEVAMRATAQSNEASAYGIAGSVHTEPSAQPARDEGEADVEINREVATPQAGQLEQSNPRPEGSQPVTEELCEPTAEPTVAAGVSPGIDEQTKEDVTDAKEATERSQDAAGSSSTGSEAPVGHDTEGGFASPGFEANPPQDAGVSLDGAQIVMEHLDQSHDLNDMRAERAAIPDAAELLSVPEFDLIELIVVTWSVTLLCFEIPDEIIAATSRLMEFITHCDLGITEIGVWRPATEELARIQFLLGAGGVSEAADAIRESTQKPLHVLTAVPWSDEEEQKSDSLDYGAMITRIERLATRGGSERDLEEAWEQFQAAVDREFVSPLVEQAKNSSDALERTLLFATAHLARQIHHTAPFVTVAAGKLSKLATRLKSAPSILKRNDCLKAMAQLTATIRELRK